MAGCQEFKLLDFYWKPMTRETNPFIALGGGAKTDSIQRHVRLHRDFLQSTATSLESRLRLTSRIRSVATRDANRLISKLNEVKKS